MWAISKGRDNFKVSIRATQINNGIRITTTFKEETTSDNRGGLLPDLQINNHITTLNNIHHNKIILKS